MIDRERILITSEMLNIIAEIDEFKGAWQLLGKLAPDRLSELKKVATIESIGSSTRIEGAKLSDREVEILLSSLASHSFQSRDEQEVAGYAYACGQIFDHLDSMPISENILKQMHIWLLQYSDKDVRHRGEYKTIPIRIEAFDSRGKSVGVIFETTSPLETPIKMRELIAWTRMALEEKSLHPLLVIGLFIVLFLAIHPFQDGNGRLSRLFTTLLMMKCGYQYVPYSSLESVIEANKESYYLALQKTQKSWLNHQPDWTPWLLFFLRSLQRQKHHLELKISREKILRKDLSNLSKHVLELLSSHGRLGIREMEVLTQANRNTLKKTLSALVHSHQIVMHGKGKASWYSLL
jgi:Fic family protein